MGDKLRYEDLPAALALVVGKSDFLRGVTRPEAGTIVLWVLDKPSRRQRELEFDLTQGKLLSNQERMEKMPPEVEIYSQDATWKIRISYRLEAATGVCYEVYSISPVGAPSRIIESQQIYFAPTRIDVNKIVDQAIRKANLPKIYSQWDSHEKISYWVSALYRLRRSNAESGFEEDNVFDSKLVSDMRRLDSKIESILPNIISELAKMEGVDAEILLDTFCRRTGFKLNRRK